MTSSKFEKWKKSQVLYGNPPLSIYRSALEKLDLSDLENLQLKTQSKKDNILLMRKIYFWVVSTLTIGFISTGLVSPRKISSTPHLKQSFFDIATSFCIFASAYFILIVTLLIVIQSAQNTIRIHLKLIEKQIKIKKESKECLKILLKNTP